MKLLTTIALAAFSITFLNAQTTMCFKENHKSMSTIDTTKLDGGLCQSQKSATDMNKEGWATDDIKIDGKNYVYIFKKQTSLENIDMEALEAKIVKKLQDAEEKKKKLQIEKTKIANLASGKSKYISTCQNCHGESGELKSNNTSRAISNLSIKEFKASMRGYVINDEDYDRGRAIVMKPYADNATTEDITNIYSYLQSLKTKKETAKVSK